MAFIGEALASHLVALKGLYSIQLPEALRPELETLATRLNGLAPRRAIYVSDLDLPLTVFRSRWAEVLKWRTDDDRIFLWERGAGEPDSSFKSVVREFIGPRFPIGGSFCDLSSLAALCIRHLFKSKNLVDSGAFFTAFEGTSQWIAEAYAELFRKIGATAASHWTDRFLVEWSAFCDQLPAVVDRCIAVGPQPRFAWELLRVAGLIVPTVPPGNPFTGTPQEYLPQDRKLEKYLATWQATVERFFLTSGQLAVLLNELDRLVQGAGTRSPWRDLDWDTIQSLEAEESATAVGRRIFSDANSLSVIGAVAPTFPASPQGAWWGVTQEQLDQATEAVERARPVRPQSGTLGIIRPFDSTETYLLDTRRGTVSFGGTTKKWRCILRCEDLRLEYREQWKSLFVGDEEPAQISEGDAWIQPNAINLKISGKDASVEIQSAQDAAGILHLTATVKLDYSGNVDGASGRVTGTWNSERKLTLTIKLRDRLASEFGSTREIKSDMVLVVPSIFSTTLVIANSEEVFVSPSGADEFTRESASETWQPVPTPEVRLSDEGSYTTISYEGAVRVGIGAFKDTGEVLAAGTLLALDGTVDGLCAGATDLADSSTVCRRIATGEDELAVVRILEEKTAAVSSAMVAVLQGKPPAKRPPSGAASQSILGRYQTTVVRGVCNALGSATFTSLFQTVVASGTAATIWPDKHPGTTAPLFIGNFPASLPGIGNGPVPVFAVEEWNRFRKALESVCGALGLDPTAQEAWLSGFDPSAIPSARIREYNAAHTALIGAAKRISPPETFWASYPFSIVITNGERGRSFGHLQAILLSPLHPVRLTWAHAVATLARHIGAEESGRRELLGLAEGWNFPLVGYAPSPTHRYIPLAAVPIDAGPDRDFIQWSALAVVTNGLTDSPAEATGLPLPWAGRSGINDKVVERALDDYLNISPYVGSIVIDLRSVTRAPRSAEIDTAVLRFLTDTSNPSVAALGGGARVWDSDFREGPPPTRDDLLNMREDSPEADVAFEWRRYDPAQVPADADVALVENAGVSIDVVKGSTSGLIGALPIRRLLPAQNAAGYMDQNYTPVGEEDVLALAPLLRCLEAEGAPADWALRASPSLETLGIGKGGKWEVIGTFNLSPRLLSLTLSSGSEANRLLWEWRPSWLNPDRDGHADPARRPYYVVARIPASLRIGLATRQALAPERISRVISELGRRAVGLATLYAAGDTHENAAAGFFYALQALAPCDVTLSAGWIRPKPWFQSIVPIDPLAELLAAIAGKKFNRRADLLAIGCTRDQVGVHICCAPIEVKHHGNPTKPEARPDESDSELKRAREQLKQTLDVLTAMRDSFPAVKGNSMLGFTRRLALGVLMDFALDFATEQIEATGRGQILADILAGRCSITLGTPSLMWFAPGSMSLNGAAIIRDQHTSGDLLLEEAYIDPYAVPGLWWPNAAPHDDDRFVRVRIDDMMTSVTAGCSPAPVGGIDLRPALKSLLRITDEGAVREEAAVPAPAEGTIPAQASEKSATTQAIPGVSPQTRVEPSSPAEIVVPSESAPSATPQLVLGARQIGARWTILGKLATAAADPVALDLDQPKVLGIFGYMGSGKSYLLGTIVEAAVQQLPNLNQLTSPLAVVVFNYRRNASDRFELSTLTKPNADGSDLETLAREFGAKPAGITDAYILALRGELTPGRLAEYGGIPAQELLFRPAALSVEDWELLMGEPAADRLYSQLIRHALIELREQGDVSVESLRARILNLHSAASRNAAEQRLLFAERHISDSRGTNFAEIVRPGRVLVIDLRQPLFSRDDALRFFLVCANHISRVQGEFNKLIIFDEAHEYLSDAFGDKLDSRLRQIRHEGTSYIFATQDAASVPREIQRHIGTKFVFGLGSHQNVQDLADFAPEFARLNLTEIPSGQCFVQSTMSFRNFFLQPRALRVRPRATSHGGGTRVFS